MKRRLKRVIKHALFILYKWCSRLGIHILPNHYYAPLPNLQELQRNKEIWARKSLMPGISSDLNEQAATLRAICLPYRTEYEGNPAFRHATAQMFGPGYGYIEAQALHAVIRHYRPQRIIEVGSGVSTWCILHALRMKEASPGKPCKLTCIEPYPSIRLKELEGIDLLQEPVQKVRFSDAFSLLQENDILFIDSSHTVKPGSDVNYLILEILPRLAPGVIVHFHDIYFPYDYQRSVLHTFFYWMETSLLRAFLIGNKNAAILFCLSQLHYDRQDVLYEVFPEYHPQPDDQGLHVSKLPPGDIEEDHFPSSIYIQIQG